MLSKAFLSITAPMKFRKSATSPMRISLIISWAQVSVCFHSDLGTYTRLAAEHFCPWYSKAPRTMATASALASAEGWAIMKSLPPVSPTMRGYERYRPMFRPIVSHMELKTPVEPVKCTPARSGCDSATLEIAAESPATKLMTPGGRPASVINWYMYQAESMAVPAGFHSTTLPMSAGADERLPPIAVKLNGVTA